MSTTQIDWAHTPQAQRQRSTKARLLARWCYDHGIGTRIAECPPDVRRRAARRAGVPPPQEPAGLLGETWRLVLRLLEERSRWDHAHGVRPPAAAECAVCEILGGDCGHQEDGGASRCAGCGEPMHPALAAAGETTHPSCDPASSSGGTGGGRTGRS